MADEQPRVENPRERRERIRAEARIVQAERREERERTAEYLGSLLSVREVLEIIGDRPGHIQYYTASSNDYVLISNAGMRLKVKNGSKVLDKICRRIKFYPEPVQQQEIPEPIRVNNLGNRGIFDIIENPYIGSPIGEKCAQQSIALAIPERKDDIEHYFEGKGKKARGARSITAASIALSLDLSYYVKKFPKTSKGKTYYAAYYKADKTKNNFLALIDPYTGRYPTANDPKHWIAIKPSLQVLLNGLTGLAIEIEIANHYMQYRGSGLVTVDMLKETKPIYFKQKKDISNRPRPIDIIYGYDLETYDSDHFETYACGFKKLVVYHEGGEMDFEYTKKEINQFPVQITTGMFAVADMLEKIDEELGPTIPNQRERVLLYAHNGARFDLYVALQDVMLFNDYIPSSIIKTPGGIIELKMTSKKNPLRKFVFRDTCKHLQDTLKKLAIQYDFPILKGDIDHSEITKDNWEEKTPIWKPYLEADVNVLCHLIVEINRLYQTVGLKPKPLSKSLPVNEYLTSSSASIAYCIQDGFRAEKHTHPAVREFIKKGTIGGRVQCCIESYQHPQWEEMLANLYKNEEKQMEVEFDNLVAIDGEKTEATWDIFKIALKYIDEGLIPFDENSLYPSAMAERELHVGGAIMFTGTTEQMLKTENLVIANIDKIIPPKNILFPLLSVKQDDGSLVWANEDIIGGTFTNIDLQEAVKYGYKLGNIIEAVEWTSKSDKLQRTMKHLYSEKLKAKSAKNKILEAAIKLIQNSSYGKMVQKDIMDKWKFVKTIPASKNVVDYKKMPGGYYLIRTVKPNECPYAVGGPSHVGAEILSISKKILNDAIASIDGFYEPVIYYTDTDSIYIPKKLAKTPALQKYIGKGMGQCKNDFGEGEVIVYARFICSKVKLCISFNSETGILTPHTTFKGGCMAPEHDSTKYEIITSLIKQFEKFKNGEFSHNQEVWKRNLETGVKIMKTVKVYGCSSNKRLEPQLIKDVVSVMPPFGYEDKTKEVQKQNPIVPQKQSNIELDKAKKAIDSWVKGDIEKLCITGGPGTGKTTLIRTVASDHNDLLHILAPTNLAANMYNKGETIHRFLAKQKECFSWEDDMGNPLYSSLEITHTKCVCEVHQENECDPLKCSENICKCGNMEKDHLQERFSGLAPLTFKNIDKHLIIDEFSMVDRSLILSANRVLIVGDLNQLGPVDGEEVTTDDLKGWTVIELKHNYRAKNDEIRELYNQAYIEPQLALRSCPKITREECYAKNIPILTWRNKIAKNMSTEQYPRPVMLTRKSSLGHPGMIFSQVAPFKTETDSLGVKKTIWPLADGQVAITRSIKHLHNKVRKQDITRSDLKKYMTSSTPLMIASAFTTHKAQGQTFDAVAIHQSDMDSYKCTPFYTPKLLYTAITRGKEVYRI